MSDGSIYASARLAAGYACSRPPVHEKIIEVVTARLRGLRVPRVRQALDVGCGAGLSTAALELLADEVTGLEPARAMLEHAQRVAPRARFVGGRAEHLPFRDEAFDLLTAAGSINYAEPGLFLPEAARVLSARGLLVIYDFSAGRRLDDDDRLAEWFASFEQRYPYPPGYAMDVEALDYEAAGLRLFSIDALDVLVPMTAEAYLAYVLTETNVEQAVQGGVPEEDVGRWCRDGIAQIFGDGPRDVFFDACIALVATDGRR